MDRITNPQTHTETRPISTVSYASFTQIRGQLNQIKQQVH